MRIRYCKLHFTLMFTEETMLPRNKASALRGGMGEMLLRMNCIRDRRCAQCDFETECLVRRTLYSQMEIRPAFMSQGDSVGYVLECENYEEHFRAGETLRFNLVLFGKTIIYFAQFLQAIHQLGNVGLGKHKSLFVVQEITNTQNKTVLSGYDVFMQNVRPVMLSEYVSYRKKRAGKERGAGGTAVRLLFHTPLSLKYRGELLRAFDMTAIMEACARRLYVMHCFEGIDMPQTDVTQHVPQLLDAQVIQTQVRRYSSTHDEKIGLNGIRGYADIAAPDETALDLLLAAEVLHIGKNTSFGFGRMTLTPGSRE